MTKRGSVIAVPDSWLDQCREWRKKERLSLEATGVRLGRTMRRSRSYAISTVRRYLLGDLVTDELTRAFAKAMGVAYPVQVIESEEHQRWCELGARLDKLNGDVFAEELRRLERYVETLAELERLRDM